MKYLLFFLCILGIVICSVPKAHYQLRALVEEDCGDHGHMENNECICEYGYYGDDCSDSCPGLDEDTETGYLYECSGYGECIEETLKCKCDDYAFGDDCSLICDYSYRADDDNQVICSDHGSCELKDGNATCICETGYFGSGCEFSCPFTIGSNKELIQCSNHGTCEVDDTIAVCKCNEGYGGADCSKQCPGLITEDGVKYSCNHHGTCNDEGECECLEGYYGLECNLSCPGLTVDQNGKPVECSGHGVCDSETMQCQCSDKRYVGDDCKCDDKVTCSGQGKCNEFNVCICEHYSGEFCSVNCDYEVDCNSHGVCTDDASCLCIKNYYGEHCEKTCDDKEDCSNNGICVYDGICLCNEGYEGTHCETESKEPFVEYDVLLVVILLVLLTVQLFLFYKQTKQPRFAEKLKTNQPKSNVSHEIELNQIQEPKPIVGGWTCPACTMVNPPTASRCSICNTPKTKTNIVKPKRVKRSVKTVEAKKETEKSENQVEEAEEKKEISEKQPVDVKEEISQEGELFKDNNIRVTAIKKKLAENQFDLLLQFYSFENTISSLSYSIATPGYISLQQEELSSDEFGKDSPASQHSTVTLNENKPLKLKIEGSYMIGEQEFKFQTGGLSLE